MLFAAQARADEVASKEAAKSHFDAGNSLLARGETSAALIEFQTSRALFATRGNTRNTAIALQRLGRFDEALEVYLVLLRDFPPDASELARVEHEMELLRSLTGTLTLHLEDGCSVRIDGRERGLSPFAQPLIVLAGSHHLQVTKPGHAEFQKQIEIVTGTSQDLTVTLVAASVEPSRAPVPPTPVPSAEKPAPVAAKAAAAPAVEPARSAPHAGGVVAALDLGVALAPGLGGPLSDQCGSGCTATLPFGGSGRVRTAYRLASDLEFGLELSYLALRMRYENRTDIITPKGWGPQSGAASDELGLSAWLVGGYVGWSNTERVRLRASFAAGIGFERVTDQRDGQYQVTPPGGVAFTSEQSVSQVARGTFVYLAPELGAAVAIAPRLELGLGLEMAMLLALSAPRFDASKPVVVKSGSEAAFAYFQSDELIGSPIFAFMPRLGLKYHF